MNAQGVEAVIIEDLVRIGEDIGMEKGLEKGMEKGMKQGLVQGLKRGLLTGLLDLCDVLGLPVDAQRRAELDAMDVPELEALAKRLKTTRAW